jgi:hypothetical protein
MSYKLPKYIKYVSWAVVLLPSYEDGRKLKVECMPSFGSESSRLLCETPKIKVCTYIILSVFCVGVKLGRSHLGKNIDGGCSLIL